MVVAAGDLSLEVLHTPGHAPDHICLWHAGSRTLFGGDLLIEGSTVVVPGTRGGDLIAYLASLSRVAALEPRQVLPAHGPAIDDPIGLIERYSAHRASREREVLARHRKWRRYRRRDRLGRVPIAQRAVAAGGRRDGTRARQQAARRATNRGRQRPLARRQNRMTENSKGYQHPELLVTPQALAAALGAGENPLLLDLRPAEQYAEGHLPGAVHLDIWGISLIDTDPAPLKAFLWIIEHLLAERGVSADRPVVLYEETSGNARRHGPSGFSSSSGIPTCECSTAASARGRPQACHSRCGTSRRRRRRGLARDAGSCWPPGRTCTIALAQAMRPSSTPDPTASISARWCARRAAARFQVRFTSSGSRTSVPTAHSSQPRSCRRCSSRPG